MTTSFDTVDVKVLHDILVNLVTAPEDVSIERKLDEQGVLLSIKVNSKDMGIVIGRNGSMATAIKTVMRALGKANKMNIRIQFLEPDGTIRYGAKDKPQEEMAMHMETQAAASQALDDDLSDFVIN